MSNCNFYFWILRIEKINLVQVCIPMYALNEVKGMKLKMEIQNNTIILPTPNGELLEEKERKWGWCYL